MIRTARDLPVLLHDLGRQRRLGTARADQRQRVAHHRLGDRDAPHQALERDQIRRQADEKKIKLDLRDGELGLESLGKKKEELARFVTRIDVGTYGLCINCGTLMAEKRLNAVPWAPYCLDCQELSEKGMLPN